LLYFTGGVLGASGFGLRHAVKEHSSSATAAAAFHVVLSLARESMGLD
jgi:hypothetical protein